MNKKFELIPEGCLFRIRALRDICVGVPSGTLGGLVESEESIAQNGDAWVFGNAQVPGGEFIAIFAACEGFTKSLASVDGVAWVSAGCRFFCLARAIEHWKDREDRPQTRALLAGAIALAESAGLRLK